MQGAVGQQYVINVFGRGIAQDLNHDLPIGQVRDTYIHSHRLAINQDLINSLKAINGDAFVGSAILIGSGVALLLALFEMSGYVYTFWAFDSGSEIKIYRNTTLIGESDDFPGSFSNGYLYVDGNPDSNEIAITDNDQVPIVLDVDDMYDERLLTAAKYMANYDKTVYEVNQDTHLTQPVFRQLNNVGIGGGVKVGSYSYAYRLVSDNGDETSWSPPTPFIPVPSNYDTEDVSGFVPGVKTYGEAASLNQSKYGVEITFRVVNYAGFDYVELKRIPNQVGGPIEYTAAPEYVRLSTSISEVSITVIDFVDIGVVNWATLDDSNVIENSIIEAARTVRFYDNRLVLGGITYSTREIDDTDLFNDFSNVAIQGIAYKEDLGSDGYTNIKNQVYKKSQRLGEKYSYAVQPVDSAGSRSFAIPIPDLVNFKFPERRETFGANESAYSATGAKVTAATIYSDDAADLHECYEVYKQGTSAKSGIYIHNILDGPSDVYKVLSPKNREDRDIGDLSRATCDIVEGVTPYSPTIYGNEIKATGMKIAGVDTSNFPDWVNGFSVLRSAPAGRVVTQGLAAYALIEHAGGELGKHKDKIWVYSPELDSVIGDKPGVFDDIIDNPEDYEIQLVSPVAWVPEFYSGGITGGAGYGIDFISRATAYFSADDVNPFDAINGSDTGRGDGYVTFGRWRNQSAQGSGINQEADDYVFGINTAVKNSLINSTHGHDMVGRSQCLEITLDAELYNYDTLTELLSSDHVDARNFHEPFYVVNIVKTGARVADNNIDIYKEIGHYIKLNSLIGLGSGVLNQFVEIVSERVDDFHGSLLSILGGDFTYIWVNDQRWLNVTHWQDADITAIRTTLDSASTFNRQYVASGYYSGVCYGIYTVEIINDRYYVKFPYQTIGTPTDITPEIGESIEVRYNSDIPIDILLGDVVIGPAVFTAIDVDRKQDSNLDISNGFEMRAAFPFLSFQFKNLKYYCPTDVANVISTDRYENGTDVYMTYIRQWLLEFMCESTVNLPFVYKDFFPYKNYVMRPLVYDEKEEDETVEEYLAALNIQSQYNIDYPGEYMNWNYGGFYLPSGYNFDHNKQHRAFYSTKPMGIDEILSRSKRIQWGVKKSSASIVKGISKTFPVTNVYDILLKEASEINILYDQYTGKGTNLYAVMDRGVVGLITDKRLLRDGLGDELGIILSDSGFIQGEIWPDILTGSPDLRWRGRAEGSIKTPQGVHMPALVFVGDDDLHILSGNSVSSLGTNFRNTLVGVVSGITDSTILTSTIDSSRNELWIKIGDTVYIYGFSVNNWVAKNNNLDIVGLTFAKLYDSSRMVRIGVTNVYYPPTTNMHAAHITKSDSGFDFDSDINDDTPVSYVTFAVTPVGLEQFEFTDIFINSTICPSSVVAAIDVDLTDRFTAWEADIKSIPGLYRVTLGRTDNGSRLIANTLYVRVAFTTETDVSLAYVKTGYKSVEGG